MAHSQQMIWPYPDEGQNPSYRSFTDMVNGEDVSFYASREDRSIILANGGEFSWTVSTSTLTWSSTLNILSPIAGFHLDLLSKSIVISEGQFFFVTLIRMPTGNSVLVANVAGHVPNTDNDYAIAYRLNDVIYFRTGISLADGDSSPIFGTAAAAATVPEPPEFGNFVGNFTFDGTTTIQGIAPSGNIYTLTKDIYGANITVNSGVSIHTANWAIFVTKILTNNGTISNNGANGGTGTADSQPNAERFNQGSTASLLGNDGNPSINAPLGYFAASSAAISPSTPGGVGASGTNGSGNGGAGGASNVGTAGNNGGAVTLSPAFTDRQTLLRGRVSTSLNLLSFGSGGGGGSNGASNNGYGGSGGGMLYVCAETITGTGNMRARGGAGGNANPVSTCGGGGGGGGGFVVLIYGTMSGQTIDANGGVGGIGENGCGGGGSGGSGAIVKFNLSGDGT